MNRKLCLLFLVCLSVALVKSESTIEVDENGDEYEVKRFNIQGRQLNEGRSQCVVTRRKRATQPKPMYSDDGSNDDVDDKVDGDAIKGEEQQAMLYYSPPMVKDKEGDESAMVMNEMSNDKVDDDNDEAMNTMEVINNNNNEEMKAEDNEDYNGEYNDTIEVIQLPQLPILGQLQSDGETVAAVASASSSANAGYVSGHHANVGSNGIVVVQSHTPPKVNPQTHAVFELVPVNHAAFDKDDDNGDRDDDYDGDHDDDNDTDDVADYFDFSEDINPVSTTAFWSTGEDNLNDVLDVRPQKLVKKDKKPVKANKKKKKTSLKPKRKNKRRLISDNKKQRNNKRRPYRTSVRRPTRRNKLRRGYTTRRGRPQSNQNQAISKPSSSQHKNRKPGNSVSQNGNRGSNSKNKATAKKQNKKKLAENIGQGSNTYTRTVTMSNTEDEAGDKYVNCIIIRKDAPTTTPRPFWNILGRSDNGAAKASSRYGQRKRVNVRFVA